MTGFSVKVLGTGDAFSASRNPSALLLSCDGFYLAIDCPDRYRKVLKETGTNVPLEKIDHFVITHVHGDHMNGLEGVAFYKHFLEKKKVKLIAATPIIKSIWNERLIGSMSHLLEGKAPKTMKFGDYFDPIALEDKPKVGPFTISMKYTKHHVPTTALLIECCGEKLGYSSDTSFDPSLWDFLKEANVIVHEATHVAVSELLRNVSPSLLAKTRLIHYPDNFAENGRLLRDGETFRV